MPYSSEVKYLLNQSGIDIHRRSSTSPISLGQLGRHFGFKFRKVSMHRNTCGMLVPSSIGTYIIINADHPYTRRRFSTAHEIGHHFLGHESDVSQANEQDRFEEVQANKFASCLLMPDDLLYYTHKEQTTIKDMARWLRVSQISVSIRCMQLGLRPMEAEFVKSEYFYATYEIAATSERMNAEQPKKSLTLPRVVELDPEREKIKQQLIDRRYETKRKKNEEMLDRYRRMYGYE